MGITDKYWLAALIPDQNKSFKAIYTYDNGYIAYYRSLNATKLQLAAITLLRVKYLLVLKKQNSSIDIKKIMGFIILIWQLTGDSSIS